MDGSAKPEVETGTVSPLFEDDLSDPPGPPSTFPPSAPPANLRWNNPFEKLKPVVASRVKQVWAIGGGKGGVGKSLIASSLALSLARDGNEIVALDLDLGGANLHTTLGVNLPKRTLSDFISEHTDSLNDCVVPSGIPRLSLIPGANDAVNVANIGLDQKARLLQKIRDIDADYVILDLGAGTNENTVDFFLYADIGILSLLPEPTSIENAYRFIKAAYYRRLRHTQRLHEIGHLIEAAMDANNALGLRSPSDLFAAVNRMSPEAGMRLKEEIERFRPKAIVNQARTQTDIEIGFSVKTVVKRYFGVEMDYLGYLEHDSAVWQAVRRKRPLLLEFPNSRIASSLERIAQYLVKRHSHHRNDLY